VRYYQKNEHDWDYGVFYGRFLDKEQIQNGYFPDEVSGQAIHLVTADGVPLTAVLKNDAERIGYKGVTALKSGDTSNALRYLNAATQKYPKDMELWTDLALANINTGNAQGAKEAISKARGISSLDLQTEMTAGEIALTMNDMQWAQQIYSNMIENYPAMGNGFLGLAKVQAVQGNFDLALENVNHSNEMAQATNDGRLMQQGYMTMAFIYQRKGDMATAQKYYQAAQQGR
jgi:tetratricopeptide (TPR) repeat protein